MPSIGEYYRHVPNNHPQTPVLTRPKHNVKDKYNYRSLRLSFDSPFSLSSILSFGKTESFAVSCSFINNIGVVATAWKSDDAFPQSSSALYTNRFSVAMRAHAAGWPNASCSFRSFRGSWNPSPNRCLRSVGTTNVIRIYLCWCVWCKRRQTILREVKCGGISIGQESVIGIRFVLFGACSCECVYVWLCVWMKEYLW